MFSSKANRLCYEMVSDSLTAELNSFYNYNSSSLLYS